MPIIGHVVNLRCKGFFVITDDIGGYNHWVSSFFIEYYLMSNTGTTGRIPLWFIGTIVGTLAITLLAVFFYGSYTGIGSSL